MLVKKDAAPLLSSFATLGDLCESVNLSHLAAMSNQVGTRTSPKVEGSTTCKLSATCLQWTGREVSVNNLKVFSL